MAKIKEIPKNQAFLGIFLWLKLFLGGIIIRYFHIKIWHDLARQFTELQEPRQDKSCTHDWKAFNSAVMEQNRLKHPKRYAANGDRMITVGNQIIYTDASETNPEISKVIEFSTDYASEMAIVEEIIYDYEEGEYEIETAYKLIEKVYGTGFITEYSSGTGKSSGRFDRPAKRRKSLSNDYHNNFLKNRVGNALKNAGIETNLNSEKVIDEYEEVIPGKLGLTDDRIDTLLSGGYYGSSNKSFAQAYIA